MSPLSPEIAAYKAAYGLFAGNGGDILPKCPKLWLKSGNGSLTVSLSGVTELLGDSTFSSTSFVSFFSL